MERFAEVWSRILAHEGEAFRTVRGLPFRYMIDSNAVIPDRTGYPLHVGSFRKAYENGPVPGPGALPRDVMGPSYVWAILNDKRIAGSSW